MSLIAQSAVDLTNTRVTSVRGRFSFVREIHGFSREKAAEKEMHPFPALMREIAHCTHRLIILWSSTSWLLMLQSKLRSCAFMSREKGGRPEERARQMSYANFLYTHMQRCAQVTHEKTHAH